jgi:hypothetical protein
MDVLIVSRQYVNLTNNDTYFSEITQEELIIRKTLQIKFGITKLEIEALILSFPG